MSQTSTSSPYTSPRQTADERSFCLPRLRSERTIARRSLSLLLLLAGLLIVVSCSSEKFLTPGEHVLSDVKITSSLKQLKTSSYDGYLRQHSNTRWFTLFKVPLGIYNLSSADSVRSRRGFQRMLKNIGEAPVVYDREQTAYSARNLSQALVSEGYLRAEVDTLERYRGHKVSIEYRLKPGARYYIRSIRTDFDTPALLAVVKADSVGSLLHQGMPLNLSHLSEERSRIIRNLHNRGYYYINNEYISFDIDTIAGSLATDVTLRFAMPPGVDSLRAPIAQRFHSVRVIEEPALGEVSEDAATEPVDSVEYRGLQFRFHGRERLNKRLYLSQIGLRPDSIYSEKMVHRTYQSLNALPAVSFTSIQIRPTDTLSLDCLDCDIHLRHNKPHSIGLEVEGTNTAGDLGAAVALSYNNRNLFHGSELLTLKLRGAYEAITGLEGYANQNYIEWSAEANLRFPTLLMPFVSLKSRRTLRAFSEAKIMYDMQDRPEFHRRVLTGAWSYRWNRSTNPRWQHFFDLFSLNYVYMPWISETFRKEYLEGDDPHYSVLRYSYENLFIMKTSYNFAYNSLRDLNNQPIELYSTNGYQIKMGIEFAGNLLYGLSRLTHAKRGESGSYDLFGIAYSQYAKFDFDFAKSIVLSDKNSLAFHLAFGLGIPYGNSTILPYEKRYFAGGANSVRGWSVRELGPGSYREKDGKVDFVNQTGNLKLDLSVEWRTYLFWKIHGAFFLDAGNIWNTRQYADMPNSVFRFDSFYKQIALSYGLGLRFNFDYFILRLDGGMKAIDPAVPSGRLHYPISKPNFKRDFTLHFAVGLPF